MATLTTFLTYTDQAEQAAKLYTSIFDGKILETARYPKGAPAEGSVMTVAFEILGQRFVALNGGPHFTFSEGFSILVTCETQAEIDTFWGKLIADGGTEGPCGWCKDRFGVSWQVVPRGIDALLANPNAMQAMLKMKKLELAVIKAAAR